MTITSDLVVSSVLFLIGAGLYMLGFVTASVLAAGKKSEEEPVRSCKTCTHSKRGELDVTNSNCAKCLTTYANAGYERRK